MLEERASEIIKNAARQNRTTFYDLDEPERRFLVAKLLHESEQGLIDSDRFKNIQSAVANVILTRGENGSLEQLHYEIDRAFLGGFGEESHYSDEIQALLHEQWDENNRKSNEHFEHDIMQRIRDIQNERRIDSPY